MVIGTNEITVNIKILEEKKYNPYPVSGTYCKWGYEVLRINNTENNSGARNHSISWYVDWVTKRWGKTYTIFCTKYCIIRRWNVDPTKLRKSEKKDKILNPSKCEGGGESKRMETEGV